VNNVHVRENSGRETFEGEENRECSSEHPYDRTLASRRKTSACTLERIDQPYARIG